MDGKNHPININLIKHHTRLETARDAGLQHRSGGCAAAGHLLQLVEHGRLAVVWSCGVVVWCRVSWSCGVVCHGHVVWCVMVMWCGVSWSCGCVMWCVMVMWSCGVF